MNTDLLSLARVHGDFWAIKPEFGNGAVAYLRDADYEAHLEAYRTRVALPTARTGEVREDERPYSITKGVALISIDGVMTRKPTSYGGASTLLTQHAVRLAGRDQDVKSILIVFSSPGGSVNGLQELTDEIAAVAAVKPVRGYVPDGAFSAAYYVATACTSLMAERTAQVGSLGTMTVIRDSSEAAKNEGVSVEVISTNDELKGQGTPGTAISDAYRKEQRNHVLAYGQLFRDAITTGRGLRDKQVGKVFTGACFMAPVAKELGLIDAIGTLDDAMAELVETTTEPTEDDPNYGVRRAAIATGHPEPAHTAAETILAATNTISAREGGEATPSRVGKTEPTPKAAGNPNMDLKYPVVRALEAFGLGTMAAKLANSDASSENEVANALASSVNAQVEEKVAANPLIVALSANGIKSPSDLSAAMELREVGSLAIRKARENATKACVAAKGPERGATIAKQLDTQPYAVVMQNMEAWQAEADATFGTTDKPGERQTAPTGTVATADEPEAPKTAYDRLNADQKASVPVHLDERGREMYAKNLLEVVN